MNPPARRTTAGLNRRYSSRCAASAPRAAWSTNSTSSVIASSAFDDRSPRRSALGDVDAVLAPNDVLEGDGLGLSVEGHLSGAGSLHAGAFRGELDRRAIHHQRGIRVLVRLQVLL